MKFDKDKHVSFSALYFLLMAAVLTLFFELWRLIVLIRQWDLASAVPGAVLLQSFLVGARFDFVIASYIVTPLYVIGIIPLLEVARRRIARLINFIVLLTVTAVVFLLHLIDIEFFAFFNSRLSGMALTWRDTPDMMVSMIWDMYPVAWYLLLYAVILAAFIWVMRWLQRRLLVRENPSPVWVNLLYLPLVLVILGIGARGRIEDKSPIRTGVAYFSEYDFANQLALNPAFTFWRDAIYDARDKDRLEEMVAGIDCPDAEAVVRQLLGAQGVPGAEQNPRICRSVRFVPQNDNPPNVVLIMMESFSSTKTGVLDNRYPYDLSPCFDSLAGEGILLTNIYSCGMHTYTGLFSALTGCPHQFTELIMKQVPGQTSFWSLASMLREHGYHTFFFTTHDPHFDNMQGFVMANGVEKTYSLLDFDPAEKIGTWGVPDHVMFDKVLKVLRGVHPNRFFAMLLTTSNHGPWTIPDVPFERVPPDADKSDELNAFKYSDWALGRFVRQMQNDTGFANTVIVITSDNGTPYRPVLDLDLTQYQIPLLILDTQGNLSPDVVGRLGSQLDILATVMGLVRLDYDDYSFGHDLLAATSTATDFAHFSEWFSIGYIENDYYLIHRLRGGPKVLYRLDDCSINLADSLPDRVREYEKKAVAIFKTGYYNQQKPLLSRETSP